MALTYATITLRGKSQDGIAVGGFHILKNALTSFDTKHLTAAEALIASDVTVNDISDALNTYIMPNGQTAMTYYTPYFVDVDAANAVFIQSDFQSYADATNTTLDAHQATLDDHEARIIALEP